MLEKYKGRDISEKLFRADKTFVGLKNERIQLSQSMSSKIFIVFVALNVRNRIYNLLKKQMNLILSSFELDADSISNSVEEISKHLATGQPLMNKEVPDDGVEDIN